LNTDMAKKELCLQIVDALDDPKHLLSDAWTLYREAFEDLEARKEKDAAVRRQRAIGLLELAPEKAGRIRGEAIAKGAPPVVTESDINYIRDSFGKLAKLFSEFKEPEEIEDVYYSIDGELYERMFQKFFDCMKSSEKGESRCVYRSKRTNYSFTQIKYPI